MFNFPTLTPKEAAQEFRISEGLVLKAIRGKLGEPLPHIRWGRRILIRPESLRTWLKEHKAATASAN